jgi:hypothetical protein
MYHELELAQQNLGRVFSSSCGRACVCRAITLIVKQLNLKLKTQPEQLLSDLMLAFVLPKEKFKI